MKTSLLFKFIIVSTIILAGNYATALNTNGSKTVTKSLPVPADVTINMNNHSGNIKFITGTGNSVKMNTTIEVTGNTQEDEKKVLLAIENFKFELHGSDLEIDTRFYKNMNTINNRSTITLLSGDKIKVKEFKISHEIQIPQSANLKLNNKYSDIDLASLNGVADLVLYSSKLFANDFGDKTNIQAKYSKIKIGNIKANTEFDFYDTDIALESCGNMNIKSKYSKFEIGKAGNLKIESYDDKFNVDELTGLDLNSKYSDFNSSSGLTDLKMELYDCNVTVKSVSNVKFNGKYCDLNLGDVTNLTIDDSYDNNIYVGNTNKIDIGKSRYSLYEIKSLSGFSFDDSYDENIKISKLNSDFSGLEFTGKYGNIDIMAGSIPFKVDFNLKYPKIDIPEYVKISKQIKDNNNLELAGGESGGTIKINAYDIKVVIRN